MGVAVVTFVVGVLVAAMASGLVLRDVTSYDRPAVPDVPAPRPVHHTAPVLETGSMLAGLTATEADEHSVVRRVGALVALLVIVFLTAAAVGVGIYRGVSAFKG